MKKFLLAAALVAGATAQAQQVNGSFDAAWQDCIPYAGSASPNKKVVGTQPQGWNVANVAGVVSFGGLGATTIGSQATGVNGTGYAVKLSNTPNAIVKEQIVPGYMALGTPWNTSVMGSQNDGGAFGGIEFTHRPDAVQFSYRRKAAASKKNTPSKLIAYLWSGSCSQADVPVNIAAFGSPAKETMVDRDRLVLGLGLQEGVSLGGEVDYGNVQLIASIDRSLTDTTKAETWRTTTVNFKYAAAENEAAAALRPQKLNIIFSANDYFDSSTVFDSTSLWVDSVVLIYHSTLNSLNYDGTQLVTKSSKNKNFVIKGGSYDASKLTYEKKGAGGEVTTTFDEETQTLTVRCVGDDYASNPENFTDYTIHFEALPEVNANLSDISFDEPWVDCIPYTGIASHNEKVFDKQPKGWNIANVAGISGLGATVIGAQIEGEIDSAVCLTNTPNPLVSTQIVPGYMALGTPWNTSVMGSQNDGGSFGGARFNGRPDAISFSYMRSAADTTAHIPSKVIAYTWRGTCRQAEVPINIAIFGSPAKETMIDRDRLVLGLGLKDGVNLGGDVNQGDVRLVASLDYSITDTTDKWQTLEIPFTYAEDEYVVPEKINVIFSANDYFDPSTVMPGTSLSVDNVKLVYFNTLATLEADKLEGFDPETTHYVLNGALYKPGCVKFTAKGAGAAAAGSFDEATNIYTIRVEGGDISVNPDNYRLYTLQFDGTVTGIDGIEAPAADGAAYSLDGRRVNAATAKGVYIVNGKKVVK